MWLLLHQHSERLFLCRVTALKPVDSIVNSLDAFFDNTHVPGKGCNRFPIKIFGCFVRFLYTPVRVDSNQQRELFAAQREDERRASAEELASVRAELGGREAALSKQLSCLLYTSPSPRDLSTSRMPSSA